MITIRSQDRRTLGEYIQVSQLINHMVEVNMDKRKEFDEVTTTIIGEKPNGCIEYLGYYSTEERCIEIIDEIQKHINKSIKVYIDKSNEKVNSVEVKKVYEMPKE